MGIEEIEAAHEADDYEFKKHPDAHDEYEHVVHSHRGELIRMTRELQAQVDKLESHADALTGELELAKVVIEELQEVKTQVTNIVAPKASKFGWAHSAVSDLADAVLAVTKGEKS